MPSDGPEVRFLHPSSLLFSVGSAARRLLVPGLFVLFASPGSAQVWLMLLFLPAVAVAGIRYWSFRYRLEEEGLLIRQGVVTRSERHVPYQRIQNINLVQNPLHRLFEVAEVRIETAGGDDPEAVVRVLSLDAVEEMRRHVFRERGVDPEAGADAPDEPSLLELPLGELVRYGIISNRGMVVVAAAFGLAWQLDLWERFEIGRDTFRGFEGWADHPAGWVAAGAGLLVAAFVMLRVLSIVWAILTLYGFRLTSDGEDLRVVHGLLTRVTKTVPRHRVQLVSIRESFLHRCFGRVGIQLETAGSGAGESGAAESQWLAPLVDRAVAPELIRAALPEIRFEDIEWQPVSDRAFRRLARRGTVVALLAVVAATWALTPWGALTALVLVPWALLHARLWVRHAGWAVRGRVVAYRSGWWERRTSVVPFAKIQVVSWSETPFDRRNRMASVRVDTAGAGRVGHRVAVPMLDATTARALRSRLAEAAAGTEFRW